jgi:hypothetical protein
MLKRQRKILKLHLNYAGNYKVHFEAVMLTFTFHLLPPFHQTICILMEEFNEREKCE